jgi:hypothetical protein
VPDFSQEDFVMAKIHKVLVPALAMGALGLASAPAMAQLPGVDLYVGAAIGQSNADLSAADLGADDFDAKDMSWKLNAGLRAAMFGAELEYFNFGSPNGTDAGSDIDVDYKGLGAYGIFYVPLPLPVLDIYVKAGLAKVDLDIDASSINDDDTKFSYGAGVQLKVGSLAVRGEYQKFKFESIKPSLFSLGLSFTLF